jgi:hypothetical protein
MIVVPTDGYKQISKVDNANMVVNFEVTWVTFQYVSIGRDIKQCNTLA